MAATLSSDSLTGLSMLKNLPPLLSADLLHILASMGHGDDIVLVDANFPAAAHAKRLVQLPGVDATRVLDAVLSVLPLDDFVPVAAHTMQVVGDANAVPPAVQDFAATLLRHGEQAPDTLERFAFYARAAQAFAIVATGDTRLYANIVLKKGVVRS
jgi:L-fucose mutarotase